ncbi:hypothetical protein Tco_0789949 [Tanacetum coccineum]
MAALVSYPKHNMVACLEKTERNTQFHEILDFFTRSSIYYSLTVSPTVSTSLIEQFWNTATSKTINDVSYIKAKVAGKTVLISEVSIRRDLLFNDVDGIDYRKFNFSKMIFEGMIRNLDAKKQFLMVLALETSKDAQAAKILNLNTRIKKLEKKCKPNISHYRAWLRSVCRLSRKKKLAHGMDYIETEEAVNEGRQSNETEELNLDVDTEVIAEDKDSGEKGGSTVSTVRPDVDTARPDVDTARPDIGTARPEVHTANAPVSTAGVTISTADPEMKEEKAKEKGVAFKDVEDSSRPVRSITTLKPLPSIDPKDKGKGILVEEEPVKIKRKDQGIYQIERDEELAHKLHEEELAEIARIQEEKAAQEEASRVTIMEMFDEVQAAAQRKFRAAQRAAEIRSRPPTKSQLRNLMMTYLKNMGGYKHSQLKAKTFEEIQAIGDGYTKKKEVLKEPDSTKIESINKEDAGERVSDVSKKRKGGPRMKRMSKRKKTESDLEEEEGLKTFLKIVPDIEGMIDYENQERWNNKSWNFYEKCGVNSLTLEDGTEIHMHAERKYPLTKETLERMMSLKLIAESASDSAYDLLRFIQKQIDEAGSHDGGEKDL